MDIKKEFLEELQKMGKHKELPTVRDTVRVGTAIKAFNRIVNRLEARVKPEIADLTKITMWVDMIWNDIFDDDELDFNPKQMNIIGKYINDAKEKIRKQFSV